MLCSTGGSLDHRANWELQLTAAAHNHNQYCAAYPQSQEDIKIQSPVLLTKSKNWLGIVCISLSKSQ